MPTGDQWKTTGMGAASGAASGAAAGAAAGPWGAAIGAGIGGIVGGVGSYLGTREQSPAEKAQGTFGNIQDEAFVMQDYQNRQNRLLGLAEMGQYERTAMDTLQGLATGQGPSLAEMQLRDASARNMSQAQALQAGGGPGAHLRGAQAQRSMAATQGSLGGQAAQLRSQEQLGALQGLTQAGGVWGQLRNERLRQEMMNAQMMSDALMGRERIRADQQNAMMGYEYGQPSQTDRWMAATGAGISAAAGMYGKKQGGQGGTPAGWSVGAGQRDLSGVGPASVGTPAGGTGLSSAADYMKF